MGTTGCGTSTAVWCPGARSLWSLAVTKPKPGRHGARGTSWSYKCPLWMSSTRWGKVATASGEGGVVACGDLATGGTESSGVRACGSRDKGCGKAHLRISKHEYEFRTSACVFESFLACLQHRVRMSFSCLPSHPPREWRGGLSGQRERGAGGRVLWQSHSGLRPRSALLPVTSFYQTKTR